MPKPEKKNYSLLLISSGIAGCVLLLPALVCLLLLSLPSVHGRVLKQEREQNQKQRTQLRKALKEELLEEVSRTLKQYEKKGRASEVERRMNVMLGQLLDILDKESKERSGADLRLITSLKQAIKSLQMQCSAQESRMIRLLEASSSPPPRNNKLPNLKKKEPPTPRL